MDRFSSHPNPLHLVEGKGGYFRLVKSFNGWQGSEDGLWRLAQSMIGHDNARSRYNILNSEFDNDGIPAGYTYFAQLLNHDLSFNQLLQRGRGEPNLRDARLNLDSVYGRGPFDSPFLYGQDEDQRPTFHLLMGKGFGGRERDSEGKEVTVDGIEDDLLRNRNERALIGDPRDDVQILIAQMHLVFIKFHNAIFEKLSRSSARPPEENFDEATRIVTWHYQYVIVEDFLPRICKDGFFTNFKNACLKIKQGGSTGVGEQDALLRELLSDERELSLPLEFSMACYRVGHSMVRPRYDLNRLTTGVKMFKQDDDDGSGDGKSLRGMRRLPKHWTVDWSKFLDFGGPLARLQLSRRIDTNLNPGFVNLPKFLTSHGDTDRMRNLAFRNLVAGHNVLFPAEDSQSPVKGLPTGQEMARWLIDTGFQIEQPPLEASNDFCDNPPRDDPLWYYALREADEQQDGKCLGDVGSHVIALTFLMILLKDEQSYLRQDPNWTPVQEFVVDQQGEKFQLRDIVQASGAPTNSSDWNKHVGLNR